jgi:subtilisin family serine protease
VELRPDDLKSGILEATKARLHGTTVASLAAGTTNGVAPAAQVKVWRVVHVDVQADEPIALWAAAAFGKIVEANKAESHLHVINCSFGALSPNNLTAPTLLLLRSAVEKAITAGFLVVVAAGNSAQEIRFPNPNDKPSQNVRTLVR